MNDPKRFLVTLALVALVVWLAGNALLGPPGFTREYMEQFRHEHEHYLDVTKSHAYKLYQQRPELHGPDAPGTTPQMAANVAFVEEYTQRPEYRAERRRIWLYEFFFDFFNTAIVLVLIGYAARKPLTTYLDGQIVALRERIAAVQERRASAAARLEEAQEKMASLPAEEAQVEQDTEQRIARELQILAEANAHSLALMERELQDRLLHEELMARQAMKQELVDRAIQEVTVKLKEHAPARLHAKLVEGFAADMERRSA